MCLHVQSCEYTATFFAFLRAWEITSRPRSPVACSIKSGYPTCWPCIIGFKITFSHFKHSYNQHNVSITLKRRSDICTVQPRTHGISSCGEKTLVDAGHVIRFLINYLGFLLTIIQKENYNYKNYPNIKYLLTSSWIANSISARF
jgi:hypothetical protein